MTAKSFIKTMDKNPAVVFVGDFKTCESFIDAVFKEAVAQGLGAGKKGDQLFLAKDDPDDKRPAGKGKQAVVYSRAKFIPVPDGFEAIVVQVKERQQVVEVPFGTAVVSEKS